MVHIHCVVSFRFKNHSFISSLNNILIIKSYAKTIFILYKFTGTTALLQISTKNFDYLICPFKTRNEIITKLSHVFRNPKIAKIFHAIDNDFLSLRRDFQITLVGAVDTKEAYKLLTKTSEAISFDALLQKLDLNQSKLK